MLNLDGAQAHPEDTLHLPLSSANHTQFTLNGAVNRIAIMAGKEAMYELNKRGFSSSADPLIPTAENSLAIYFDLVVKSFVGNRTPPSSTEANKAKILAFPKLLAAKAQVCDLSYSRWMYLPKTSFFFLIYFWLHWVFVAACGLSLVAASGGYSSLRCTGFSLRWLLLLWSTGSRRTDSVVVARGLQ